MTTTLLFLLLRLLVALFFHTITSRSRSSIHALVVEVKVPIHRSSSSSSSSAGTSIDTTTSSSSLIGKGSYGTVHFVSTQQQQPPLFVGKRAYYDNDADLSCSTPTTTTPSRCYYYWKREKHCYEKLSQHPGLPHYVGTDQDAQGREWMLFLSPQTQPKRTLTLQDVLPEDLWKHKDLFFQQILEILCHVHHHSIVHCDLKPSNLLFLFSELPQQPPQLVLIDFGSATDLQESTTNTGFLSFVSDIMFDNNRNENTIAVSPLYAAPEIFLDMNIGKSSSSSSSLLNYDCASAALIYFQLLFQFKNDSRKMAAFRQQLMHANWNLDRWLLVHTQTTTTTTSILQGLQTLPTGMWKLLQDMLVPDPTQRITSSEALKRFQQIQSLAEASTEEKEQQLQQQLQALDGAFFQNVRRELFNQKNSNTGDGDDDSSLCDIPTSENYVLSDQGLSWTMAMQHFVATFDRKQSMGLLLAEKDADYMTEQEEDRKRWNRVTEQALEGQVFVQGVVPGSQADKLGIFQVGDRILAVGEFPVVHGFEHVLELIRDQPRSSSHITLYFDRAIDKETTNTPTEKDCKPTTQSTSISTTTATAPFEKPRLPVTKHMLTVDSQGAWSMKGRRSAQEDAVFLNTFLDRQGKAVHLGGVCDGHLGQAASIWISTEFPHRVASLLQKTHGRPQSLEEIVKEAWKQVCMEYRAQCMNDENECIAEYDAREGQLLAQMGSEDNIAGSTISLFSQREDEAVVLNCGDSRTVVARFSKKDRNHDVIMESRDHKPEYELDRFSDAGLELDCRFKRWSVPVGDFSYALSRSLEGPLATQCGIVSDPDVYHVHNYKASEDGDFLIIVATDGIWDVLSASEAIQFVQNNMSLTAQERARALCNLAFQKGSSDNLSAVVFHTGKRS